MDKTMMTENEKMTAFAGAGAHYDNLCRAAEYYGIEAQTCKMIEELGELIAELGEVMCAGGMFAALVEEMSDVYNMLDQLCILMDCEEAVRASAEAKMRRTVERIRAEEGEKEHALNAEDVGSLMTRLRGAAMAEFADDPSCAPIDGMMQALFDGCSRRGNAMARRMVHAVLDELGITYEC